MTAEYIFLAGWICLMVAIVGAAIAVIYGWV